MLYLLDNGQSYSDHEVYFIETDICEDTPDVVERLLLASQGPESLMLCIAKDVSWRRPEARVPIERHLYPDSLFHPQGGGTSVEHETPYVRVVQNRLGEEHIVYHERSLLWQYLTEPLFLGLVQKWQNFVPNWAGCHPDFLAYQQWCVVQMEVIAKSPKLNLYLGNNTYEENSVTRYALLDL